MAFGSQWLELFPSSVEKNEKSLKEAAAFIKVSELHFFQRFLDKKLGQRPSLRFVVALHQ